MAALSASPLDFWTVPLQRIFKHFYAGTTDNGRLPRYNSYPTGRRRNGHPHVQLSVHEYFILANRHRKEINKRSECTLSKNSYLNSLLEQSASKNLRNKQ